MDLRLNQRIEHHQQWQQNGSRPIHYAFIFDNIPFNNSLKKITYYFLRFKFGTHNRLVTGSSPVGANKKQGVMLIA
jgi:hypothetical protein